MANPLEACSPSPVRSVNIAVVTRSSIRSPKSAAVPVVPSCSRTHVSVVPDTPVTLIIST